jgi:hypothetical protein
LTDGSAWAALQAAEFTAFAPRRTRLLRRKFVRISAKVRRFPSLTGDFALFLTVHRGKSTLTCFRHFSAIPFRSTGLYQVLFDDWTYPPRIHLETQAVVGTVINHGFTVAAYRLPTFWTPRS